MSMATKYAMMKSRRKEKYCAEGCDMEHMHNYADGGKIKGVHAPIEDDMFPDHEGSSYAGASHRAGSRTDKGKYPEAKKALLEHSKQEHERVLGEMHEMRDQDRKYLADGGDVDPSPSPTEDPQAMRNRRLRTGGPSNNPSVAGSLKSVFGVGEEAKAEEPEEKAYGGDMVPHLAKKYSRGGQVANDTHEGTSADMQPNEFDELVKDDDLEFHETGANSGDEIGNHHEEEDERDLVRAIMRSRKKKDHNPRPA